MILDKVSWIEYKDTSTNNGDSVNGVTSILVETFQVKIIFEPLGLI